MASSEIKRLMDNARIRLPGALDAAIKIELFALLNEFFQETNIWSEDIPFQVTATTQSYIENPAAYTYEVYPGEGGIINRLMGVADSKGLMVGATMAVPGQIVLNYSPNEAQTYTARVTKTVTDPVDKDGYPECPEWVLAKYNNDLLDGVLGRMMGQLAKPYSSPQLALYHMRQFAQAKGKARAEAMHGNIYRGQNWRFPRAFSSRRY